MSYFNKSYFQFFKALEKNNHKEWFEEHRSEYEQEVKKPFKQLVTDLIEELTKFYPDTNQNPAKAIFRINRDVRFSKDKSPYKLQASAIINPGGTKDDSSPGFYLHLGHKECFLGGGIYLPSKEQLYRIRQEIMYNHAAFKKAADHAKFKAAYGEIMGESNKIIPEDFRSFFQEEPRIAMKQFYYFSKLSPEEVTSDQFKKTIIDRWKLSFPLHDFLKNALQ